MESQVKRGSSLLSTVDDEKFRVSLVLWKRKVGGGASKGGGRVESSVFPSESKGRQKRRFRLRRFSGAGRIGDEGPKRRDRCLLREVGLTRSQGD